MDLVEIWETNLACLQIWKQSGFLVVFIKVRIIIIAYKSSKSTIEISLSFLGNEREKTFFSQSWYIFQTEVQFVLKK